MSTLDKVKPDKVAHKSTYKSPTYNGARTIEIKLKHHHLIRSKDNINL